MAAKDFEQTLANHSLMFYAL